MKHKEKRLVDKPQTRHIQKQTTSFLTHLGLLFLSCASD